LLTLISMWINVCASVVGCQSSEGHDDDDGYDSPNDMSPSNLHRTLYTIMSEEKEKRGNSRNNTPGSNDNR
jgi:hypothetical protein